MSSYLGKYAEYYDIIYAQKDYAQEAAFVNEAFQRFGLSMPAGLLELACGTGRHALELERLGYQLLSTDYSNDLLNVAREKASKAGSHIKFEWADMRELNLECQDFDGAICLFDSIGYVQSDEAVCDAFAGIKRHLVPQGLFIFEFWHAEAMRDHFDPTRVRRWELDSGSLLRIAETQLHRDKDLAEVSYELLELRNDGSYERTTETQINRFFTVEKMKLLLESAGFEALKWLNGYSWDEAINENAWHVVCIAKPLS